MAKFFGAVGYAETTETAPGVWTENITEKDYSGDVLRNSSRVQQWENVNENVNVDILISILADPYAYQNMQAMRYIKWMEASWKINKVDVQRPRLILTIGGVYNGKQGPTS